MNYMSQTRTRLQPDPVALALRQLCEDDWAVALARVSAVARREVASLDRPGPDSPKREAFNILIDAFSQPRDALDNLIALACSDNDLDRSELPSTGELIDLIGKFK